MRDGKVWGFFSPMALAALGSPFKDLRNATLRAEADVGIVAHP